ncbi:TonB-dependent receptor [Comamonas sp. B-9]|uniref:TonB-dependent siderophore receptor n=1 Tax=Comamonas sp. B-9 TaxID=1055192 RepID=UPI0003958C0D|nr:TonB-dependent receptor [Comamonas sp. B-9]
MFRSTALFRRSVLAASLALAGASASQAQTLPSAATRSTPAAMQSALGIDIAIGPLAQTLNRIASQAGLVASMDPALLAGRQAPAINARLTVEQALAQALRGSGLALAITASGAISVQPAAASSAAPADAAAGAAATISLPTTVVRDSYAGATTEHSQSYTTRAVSIGKGEHALREIPQSISVLTRQQIEDQNATTLADSMRYVTGMRTKPTGTGIVNIEARGFLMGNYLIDGLPAKGGQGIWGNTLMDVGLYDRVEIWRGPTGLLEGAGEPSGTINLVRKRAHADFLVQSATVLGSWGQRRQELDVTGALNASGTLRGRLVGIYDDRDSFVDEVYLRRNTVYGTLEYDFSPSTTLSIGATEQRGSSLSFAGLPLLADGRNPDLDRSTFLGSIHGKKDDYATRYFAELEHQLDGGGKFKLSANQFLRGTEFDRYWSNSYLNPVSREVTILSTHQKSRERDRGIDAYLSLPMDWNGLEQTLVIGANYQTYQGGQVQGSPSSFQQNADHPDHDLLMPPQRIGTLPKTRVTNHGVYAHARIKPVQPLTVLVGGRLAWWETQDPEQPANDQSIRAKFVPSLGLVYDLNTQLSVYASANQVFAPQTDTVVSGAFLPARTGNQLEAGIKGEFMDKRLNAHLAVFRIQDENRAVTDPLNEGFSLPSGVVRSQGFEAEVSGKLSPQWDMTAGYAYTDTRHVSGSVDTEGQPFNSSFPRHNFSLWTKYRFAAEPLRRLWIGGGMQAYSSNATTYGNTTWRQGGYAVYALQAGYEINRHLQATVTVNNLFDRTYFDRLAGGRYRQTYYGDPRNITVALRAAF